MFRWYRKKRPENGLWRKLDEENLKSSLARIYAANDIDILQNTTKEVSTTYPKYQRLFRAASEERRAQLTQNTLQSESFETEERKVRKKWLLLFIGNYFLNWVWTTGLSFSRSNDEFWINLIMASIFTCILLCVTWPIYHCAYKKKGTVLLTWILVFSPLLFIINLVNEQVECICLRRINYQVKARKQLAGLNALMTTCANPA